MAERVVISRSRRVEGTRRVERPVESGFRFTKEMIPAVTGAKAEFIRKSRALAWELYEGFPMPTTKDEPWRRTDLRGLMMDSFQISGVNGDKVRETPPLRKSYVDLPPAPQELMQPLAGTQQGGQVVLLPEGPQIFLDPQLSAKGVIFTDLTTAEREYPHLLAPIYGQIVQPTDGKFAAMSEALANRGIFIYIPRNLQVEAPLHSVLWGPGRGLAYFSHLLVWLEEGASLTYVHESSSPYEKEGQVLHAGIVEIHVGANARLNFVELQSWGSNVWNFSHERVNVHRNGNLDWIFGSLGSQLTKNFSELNLVGEGATGRMSGFYFTNGTQHLDHDTQQNHMAPHTTSDMLFKGALKDTSRSVWQGMIYVAPGAQKTDGYQANRNLVLSRSAHADSIPGLEILADDVRCTHGVTVGKIDQEQVFYLESRGIPYPEAERLIVEGFFDPIMQRIAFEGVRSRFQQAILEKMG